MSTDDTPVSIDHAIVRSGGDFVPGSFDPSMAMDNAHPAGRAKDDVVALFQNRMRGIWERDGFRVRNQDYVIRLLGRLLAEEGPGSPNGAAVLEQYGVRHEWNRVFAADRAKALAYWVGPYLKPPVLDVLGGDFTVLRALIDNGLAAGVCIGCERLTAYDTNWEKLPFPVYAVPEPMELPQPRYRTALVSTVLHHERDPEQLLSALAAGPAERLVVIENTVDTENTEHFHLFVDEFFNRCLNQFDVSCVPQHRTITEWQDLLGLYGRVTLAGIMEDVPGIPFPYQMFIVDRAGHGQDTEAAAP
jgi:hypothetical protein